MSRKLTDEVNDTAGVTPLVVVPRDELDEVGVQSNTGLGIEDGGAGVSVQVAGDNVVLGVAKDAWMYMLAFHRPSEQDEAVSHP